MKAQRLYTSFTAHSSSPLRSYLSQSSSHSTSLSLLRRRCIAPVQAHQARAISSSTCMRAPGSRSSKTNDSELEDTLDSASIGRKPQSNLSDQTAEQESQSKIPETRQFMDSSLTRPAQNRTAFGVPMNIRRRTVDPKNQQMRAALESLSRPRNTKPQGFSQRRTQPATSTERMQAQMADQYNSRYPGKSLSDLVGTSYERNTPPIPPRIDAYVGRCQTVDDKIPLVRALSMLGVKLRVNDIKKQLREQRFHERGGLKRKRLRRERWRTRFLEGFRHMLGKVRTMKKQGW